MSHFSCNIRFTDVYFRCVNPEIRQEAQSYLVEIPHDNEAAFNLPIALLDFSSWHSGELVPLTEKDCALLNLPFNPYETTTFTYQVEVLKDGKRIQASRKELFVPTSELYH